MSINFGQYQVNVVFPIREHLQSNLERIFAYESACSPFEPGMEDAHNFFIQHAVPVIADELGGSVHMFSVLASNSERNLHFVVERLRGLKIDIFGLDEEAWEQKILEFVGDDPQRACDMDSCMGDVFSEGDNLLESELAVHLRGMAKVSLSKDGATTFYAMGLHTPKTDPTVDISIADRVNVVLEDALMKEVAYGCSFTQQQIKKLQEHRLPEALDELFNKDFQTTKFMNDSQLNGQISAIVENMHDVDKGFASGFIKFNLLKIINIQPALFAIVDKEKQENKRVLTELKETNKRSNANMEI